MASILEYTTVIASECRSVGIAFVGLSLVSSATGPRSLHQFCVAFSILIVRAITQPEIAGPACVPVETALEK